MCVCPDVSSYYAVKLMCHFSDLTKKCCELTVNVAALLNQCVFSASQLCCNLNLAIYELTLTEY